MVNGQSKPKWPTREIHAANFEQLLADAFAAEMKNDAPSAFLYIGQTSPNPTQGLVSQFVVAHASEVLAAVLNVVKSSVGAGRVGKEQLELLIRELGAVHAEIQ